MDMQEMITYIDSHDAEIDRWLGKLISELEIRTQLARAIEPEKVLAYERAIIRLAYVSDYELYRPVLMYKLFAQIEKKIGQ